MIRAEAMVSLRNRNPLSLWLIVWVELWSNRCIYDACPSDHPKWIDTRRSTVSNVLEEICQANESLTRKEVYLSRVVCPTSRSLMLRMCDCIHNTPQSTLHIPILNLNWSCFS